MNNVERWVRGALTDTNPVFPLSALLLLLGLGSLEFAAGTPLSESLFKLGILQAYELCLLGLALLVLLPRGIHNDTSSLLILFALVRLTSPFLIIGAAAEGSLGSATLIGGTVWLFMTLKQGWLTRGAELDVQVWERRFERLLFGVATLGLPLIAHLLATESGDLLSFDDSRWLRLGVSWGLAALIAPLALGVSNRSGGSRRPALLWRVGYAIALPLLLSKTFYVSGFESQPLLLMLPMGLSLLAVGRGVGRGLGYAMPQLSYVPAAAFAALLFASEETIGLRPCFPRALMATLFLPFAALALPLLCEGAARRRGARALALLVALAPFVLSRTSIDFQAALLIVSGVSLGVGVTRRHEGLLTLSFITGLAFVLSCVFDGAPKLIPEATLAFVTGWALLLGHGRYRGAALRVTTLAQLALCLSLAVDSRAPVQLVGLVIATGAVWWMLQRGARTWLARGCLASGAASFGAPVIYAFDRSLLLIASGFAALPLGAWLSLRRDRSLDEGATPVCDAAPTERSPGSEEADHPVRDLAPDTNLVGIREEH